MKSKSRNFLLAIYVLCGLLLGIGCRNTDETINNRTIPPSIEIPAQHIQELLQDPEEYAAEIHEKVLTIITHVDTPRIMEIFHYLFLTDFDLGRRYKPIQIFKIHYFQFDFPRMIEGELDAAFFAVWVPQGPRTPEGNEAAKNKALVLFEIIHRGVGKHPDLAQVVTTPQDAYGLEEEGKRAIYIGIENGYPIGNDLSLIKTFYDLGARYITLCHTSNNDICDSSTDENGPEHFGLSDFGYEVVTEMNRLGIMVDASHVSDDTLADVITVTTTPVIASHSNAQSIYDHPRNLNDDLLAAIASNGGVVMVNLAIVASKGTGFHKHPITVSDVVDHIDHIVDIAGIDHVGIGTDFDGGGWVNDCQDVSQLGTITLELVNRGYTEEEIQKIWGANFMRVFAEVEEGALE